MQQQPREKKVKGSSDEKTNFSWDDVTNNADAIRLIDCDLVATPT